MRNLMIDIETLDTEDNGAVVGIGAVFFDLKTQTLGAEFSAAIHPATAVRDGGIQSVGTWLWWLQQNEQIRKNLCFNGRDHAKVLDEFYEFVRSNCRVEDVIPWGNSARFDLGKLSNAYRRLDLAAPWYWSKERCFRTIRNFHPQVAYNPDEKGDAAHDPLTDAKFQAAHLFKIKRWIKEQGRPMPGALEGEEGTGNG